MEKTQAIVLKVSPYSETTLVVGLLTRELGVVRVLAKGARRRGRHAQASFEPLSHVEATVYLKSPEALGTLGEVNLRQGWPWLRRDLDRLAYASLGIETLAALAARHPPEPALFDLGLEFLGRMGGAPGPGSLTITLLVRLLHEAGFPPQLSEPWTARTLPARLAWDFAAGACVEAGPADPPGSMRLGREAVAPLLAMIEAPPPLDGSVPIPATQGPAILRWAVAVWEDHLGQPLTSAAFVEKMLLGGKKF
jgi:recombinational DNA repair protein (RecF pathway)